MPLRRPRIFSSRSESDHVDQEKDARLETAERDLETLQARADEAVRRLQERQKRNHWRESIERMIQGA